jgi:hypothetical protein
LRGLRVRVEVGEHEGRLQKEVTVIRKGIGIVAAVALTLALSPATGTQSNAEKLEITAFAVNMSNIATGANAVVDMRIDSWSTPEERQHLIATAMEKGPKALLKELQKAKVHGRWRIPGIMGPDPHQLGLGHDIHYAWQEPLPEGGRRIALATDRYIGFAEARNQPRSMDYPFTLMEIRVNKNGEGEGKMAVATKITYDKGKNTMVLENYASEPVRLQNLKVKTRT